MEKKRGNPGILIAVAMLMLVTGGFFTVLQVGMDARRGTGIQGGFGYRGGPGEKAQAESSYIDDLKRGSDVIKTRASDLFGDIFGGGSQAPQGEYASANGGRYRGYSADEIAGKYAPEDDAFEKYYKENYGSGSSDYSASSSYGGDAGTFYGGGGGGGSYQEIARGGDASGGGKTAAAGEAGEETPAASGQGGPQGASHDLAADKPSKQLYASLPTKGADRAYGGLPGPGGSGGGSGDGGPSFDGGGSGQGKQGGKTGGLDAFRGGGQAKDLDGALEGGRNSGAASYGANMSKNAAGVAAGGSAGAGGSGGGAVPKASEAEKVSSAGGGGSSSSSSSPSSSSGDSKTSLFNRFSGDDDAGGVYYGGGNTAPQTKADDDALLKAVVTERLNGAEDRYVTPEEAQQGVDKTLLAAGASPHDALTKSSEDKKPEPDPDSFGALTDKRKEELKKEVHVLLKRVETDYGTMKDIQFYGCSAYPDICKAHGLTENFLTMTTGTGATITLGVKYVNKRWRTYTLDFKDPSGAKPAASGKPGAIQTGVYYGDEEDEEEEE
jgi:hypothetical protein